MINLIPPQGQKLIHKEYLMRVSTVAAFAVACGLFASTAVLLPTYVLFLESEPIQEEETEDIQKKEGQYTQVVAKLKDSMILATQLGKPVNTLEASEIITHIESALSPGVTLEGMHLSQDKGRVRVEAAGSAPTRESLRQFMESLKKDSFFADAQVPVSDLARDIDVLFTITLTVRPS